MDKDGKKPVHQWNDEWAMKNWRAWGSWFSWGSPVGLGIFLVCLGAFLLLMAQAGLIGSR